MRGTGILSIDSLRRFVEAMEEGRIRVRVEQREGMWRLLIVWRPSGALAIDWAVMWRPYDELAEAADVARRITRDYLEACAYRDTWRHPRDAAPCLLPCGHYEHEHETHYCNETETR